MRLSALNKKNNLINFMKKISKGYKKFIRQEKARIRKEIINIEEQNNLIQALYQNLSSPENKIS